MNVTITVNLEDDVEVNDIEYNTDTVQDAIDQAAKAYPDWTSMVVVFCNPADVLELKRAKAG